MQYPTPPLSATSLHQQNSFFNINGNANSNQASPPNFVTNTAKFSMINTQVENGDQNIHTNPLLVNRQTEINHFQQQLDKEVFLLMSKNLSKTFDDDVVFCPRSLLSSEELNTCQKLDVLLMEQQVSLSHSAPLSPSQQPSLVSMSSVKFNPYRSQSFNPSSFR